MARRAALGLEREYARLPFVAGPKLVPETARNPSERRVHESLAGPAMTKRALANPIILVFDSGLGGLTVYREVARARPDARLLYVGDNAVFPYGRIEESQLVARV